MLVGSDRQSNRSLKLYVDFVQSCEGLGTVDTELQKMNKNISGMTEEPQK